MADNDEYTKIIGNAGSADLKVMSLLSRTFFIEEVSKLRTKRFNKKKFIISDPADVVKHLVIGRMYFFEYDPKYHDTLPVWDRYPFVLPFAPTQNGFRGINLHYLSYKQRAMLLERLVRGGKKSTNRLKVSWEILNSFSKVKVAEYATKQYLYDHVMTPFKVVPIEDYPKAIMLPIAEFYGTDKSLVKSFKWRV